MVFLNFRRTFTLVILSTSMAHANFVGNDTQNFNPVPSGLDFVTVHGTHTLQQGLLNTGFFFNQAENSLPDTYDALGDKYPSDDSVTFGDISAAYGIADNFDFGFSLSYLLHQDTTRTQSGAQFSATGLNEIRVTSKYSFLPRKPWGAAVIASMNLNQSENNPFSGEGGGPSLNLEAAVDRYFGDTLVAVNAGYRVRDEGKAYPNSVFKPLPDQYIASLAASHYLPHIDLKLIGEIFAAKATKSVAYVDEKDISSEVLVGVKYDALANTAIHGGAGTRLGDGLFTPDWRIYAGVNITFDVLHKAPPPEIDTNVSIDYIKGYVPDDIEALRNVDFDEIAKTHEFQLRTDVPDKDFAGQKPPFEIIRLNDFDFDFGSSAIRKEYYPLLERLANYIGSQPQVLKIRVEGHTDSIGSFPRNRKIGQMRADAVKTFLEKTGLVKDVSILPVGYGADRPIADNGNFQGRRQNRRVEIRILRQLKPVPEKIKYKK